VEAGLRSGDLAAPWPEEGNRLMLSRLARLHFAPTPLSRQNLLREGVPAAWIQVTGNTVIDALFLAIEKLRGLPQPVPGFPIDIRVVWKDEPVVLITGHRRESLGPGLESICRAIAELARRFPRAHFVYPVHLNPQVREPVQRLLGCGDLANVYLWEPLPYLAIVALLLRCTLVLTDSGGIQEEAPSLGKPVLVTRQTTERPEAVRVGTALLVGQHFDRIVGAASRLLTDSEAYRRMAQVINPYGDGRASLRIAAAIGQFVQERGGHRASQAA
jgi:UDP-N-acetylglucosamine 2-epimerase (non-hydrolysing)